MFAEAWAWADLGSYAAGYREAADRLFESVIGRGEKQDLLAYPMIFLYRRSVELSLKQLIIRSRRLLDKEPTHPQSHSVLGLWNSASDFIDQWHGREWRKESAFCHAVRLIRELDVVDPDKGVTFRYPGTNEMTYLDLAVFREGIAALCNYLHGLAWEIGEQREFEADMRRDAAEEEHDVSQEF